MRQNVFRMYKRLKFKKFASWYPSNFERISRTEKYWREHEQGSNIHFTSLRIFPRQWNFTMSPDFPRKSNFSQRSVSRTSWDMPSWNHAHIFWFIVKFSWFSDMCKHVHEQVQACLPWNFPLPGVLRNHWIIPKIIFTRKKTENWKKSLKSLQLVTIFQDTKKKAPKKRLYY